jgi:cobaltochelatase CobN
LPKVAHYRPGLPPEDLAQLTAASAGQQPVAAVLFYRAHLQAGNLRAFDALIGALEQRGFAPLAIAVASLKDESLRAEVQRALKLYAAAVVLNTTGFAISQLEQTAEARDGALGLDVPVLQVIASGGNAEDWRSDAQGLGPRDLAMSVVLPEVDGRIITRAFSFKDTLRRCERAQIDVTEYRAEPDRIAFIT